MSKSKKSIEERFEEEKIEAVTVEEEKIETVVKETKSSKLTATDFAKVKNLGKYYEEQFRIIFGKEEKTVEQWKKYLLEKKLVSPKVLN